MATLTPLVTSDWLGVNLHAEDLRIADCRFYLDDPSRGHAEYLAGHIPGARYFSLDDDLTGAIGPGRHPLPDTSSFVEKLGRVGIGNQHTVVVYDDSAGSIAARLWWMLRSLGHENTFVLDGGWAAWAAQPRSVTTEIPEWPAAEFVGADSWTGVIDRDDIAGTEQDLVLIDARAAERYRGETEPIDPVAGHIPGAFNLPYQDNTDESGRFVAADELGKRFAVAQSDGTVVCYCGSGVTACHNLLALDIAGYSGALLYPGSWSDWCTSGGAVARS